MKRALLLLLAVALVFPSAVLGGSEVLFGSQSVFEQEDILREMAISAALGRTEGASSRSFLSHNRENKGKYIVKFAKTLSEEAVLSYLAGTDYRLLSASEERVFSVTLADADAFSALVGEGLLYCCEDRVLTTAAIPSDPYADDLREYEQMELLSAWELVTPKSDVIVAVLDTGVNRTHEELAGAAVLDGYDAVEQTAGVFDDTDGHGTSVIGLIAATANNGVGTAGIAHGVTVLPVRVANDANRIYSSDLIGGIRFAADAGAKILNLSFGGYTYSAAEYDAVSYALEKGCILIAAAGNDGGTEQGTQPVYPASYEGVISVGSCNADGVRSDFSQEYDQVDLLAPGEDLFLIAVDEEGNSLYCEDDGTSYSAAMVSAVAALALSALDDGIRFEGGELLALLADGRVRKGSSGYGLVSGLTAVTNANAPLIVGAENGRTYSEPVTIHFNRGVAELDGEEFFDGETVYQNGRHLLNVVDGERRSTVLFFLSYTPASFEVSESAQGVTLTYSGGTATLDGVPYESGTLVNTPGWHLFALTDSLGDVRTHQFYCDLPLPAVAGVEDGGMYSHPVRISLAGNGEALLDGVPFRNEVVVTSDGEHTLTVSNGERSQTYRFTLQTGVKEYENELSRSGVISDAAHGWYAVYSEMLTGLRVYDAESGEYHSFIGTETVNGYMFAEGLLFVFGEWQLTVLDPSQMLEGDPRVASYQIRCEDFAYAGGQLYCLAEGELNLLSPEDGSLALLFETDAQELYSDGNALWLYSSSANRFDRFENGEMVSYTPQFPAAGKRKMFGAGWLFCGGSAVRLSDFSVSFAFEGYAVGCTEELLFSTNGVYRLTDGEWIGGYDRAVSCVLPTADGTFVCGLAGGIRYYPVQDGMHSHGYAPCAEGLLDTPVRGNAYTELYRLYGNLRPSDMYASGEYFAAVFADARKLLLFRNGVLLAETAMPFAPTGVVLSEGSICIWDGTSGLLRLNGVQYATGMKIEDAFFAYGNLHLLSGGRIYRFESGVSTDIGIEATAAAGAGDMIVWLSDGWLSVRVGGQTATVRSSAGSLLTDGVYVAAGKRVYLAATLAQIMQLSSDALAMYDGTLLTEGGLYDISARESLALFDASDCDLASIGGRAGAVFYSDGAFTISRFDYALRSVPFLEGIPSNGLVSGQTTLYFDRGLAYLDGKPYEEGTVIDEAGVHVFTLVLPCAVVRQYSFTVIPALEGIAFSAPMYRVAVGEGGVLYVQYLPNGTSSVPVVYTALGDCIRLEADGSFLALHEGEALVTAETADGMYRATCRVVVASALLRFDEEAGYRVDRENGLLLHVPAGMRAGDLTAQVLTEGTVEISGEIVGTGSVVTLLSPEGTELDRLVTVVDGDLDGDGYMTLRDLLLLEEMLQDGKSFEGAFAYAADINESGTVTDRDANLLRELLLFETGPSRRDTPPEGASGSMHLFYPSVICIGDTVGVTLYLQNAADVYGISGRLRYDPEVLSYSGMEDYGFTAETYDSGEWISFLATGESAEGTPAVVTLLFSVLPGTEICELTFRDGVLLCENGVFGLARETVKIQLEEREYGSISLTVPGMTEPFDFEKTEYEAVLPAGTPALDYVLCYPEGCVVTVENTVFDRSDMLEAVFTFRITGGKNFSYTIHARREGAAVSPANTTLSSLTAKEVTFVFDPAVTEYVLNVPFAVQKLTLWWAAADKNATVVCSDTTLTAGQETLITLTVTAGNGEQTVYTLKVFREGETETSHSAAIPTEPKNDDLLWLIPVLILAAGSVLIVWMHRKEKKKAAVKADETRG